jgi:glycosyltransferase involved in cell wall biosynthesis
MRILIIHRSFALVGGAERVISDKANYLSRQGHQVMLVSYEQGAHQLPYDLHPTVGYEDVDCRFFTLARHSSLIRLYHYLTLKRRFRKRLSDVSRRFNPDVVVMASDWQTLIDAVVDAVAPIPVVAEFHNAYDYIMRKVGSTDGWLHAAMTRLYYRHTLRNLSRCARLVVLTESDARCWRRHFGNVSVIPNPVTLYPDTIDDVPKDSSRIIFVGRFNHEKRIDRLISAFSLFASRHPEWHVDIFGEGNEQEALMRQIAELNLEGRIIIHQPTKAIYEEYKRCQMLVLCSEHEARPLVLVEAMSCGVPCVSLACPYGPREIIDDGKTGLLARNGDVKDLAIKMEWLIEHDEQRAQMGRNAREEAKKYKQSVIMTEWEKLYEETQHHRTRL